jgi:hypothetical protein
VGEVTLHEAAQYCILRIIMTLHFTKYCLGGSRRMRWVGHVACMGKMRNAYKMLVGKHESKRPLGRPRHRGDNI